MFDRKGGTAYIPLRKVEVSVEPGLQALLLCDDDKVVRVLRRVLSEMEIAVEHCSDADSATQKLTRQRFEAVIVDCTVPDTAGKVLSGTRSAPANRRAITVAILDAVGAADSQAALKRAFGLGAHFVLFKPISIERTRSSFRAVRALMKRERRRHARIPIDIPVEFYIEQQLSSVHANTQDLGENGMAVNTRGRRLPSSFEVRFALQGPVQCNMANETNREHLYDRHLKQRCRRCKNLFCKNDLEVHSPSPKPQTRVQDGYGRERQLRGGWLGA